MENSVTKTTRDIKEDIIAVLFVFTVPILNVLYTVINGSHGVAFSLVTVIDNKIPFIKYFILPYNLWYPFILSSLFYLCFKSRKTFYKTVIGIDMGLLLCYAVYLLFQTTVTRPVLEGNDIFTRLVGLTYKMDQPYNCFPSIHVLTSYLMMKGYNRSTISNKGIKFVVYGMALTIIISTLFVKQHVILDIASAVVLGDVVYYLAKFVDEERIVAWIKKLYSSLMMRKKLET